MLAAGYKQQCPTVPASSFAKLVLQPTLAWYSISIAAAGAQEITLTGEG